MAVPERYVDVQRSSTKLDNNEPKWCTIFYILLLIVARGSVICWGTILQAGKSWVRDPTRAINIINFPIPSGCIRNWELLSLRNEYQKQKNVCGE
jgi:hypothetical protein